MPAKEQLVSLSFQTSKDLDRAIESMAFERETTKREIIECALRRYLKVKEQSHAQ